MYRALYFEILNYTNENIKRLHEAFDLVVLKDPSEIKPEILADVAVLFAPLGYKWNEETLKDAFNLKVIATNTTGVPHIDMSYAESRGIKVISLKDEQDFLKTITPTAELTFGLIILVTRNIVPAAKSVLEGKWSRWDFGGEKMLSRMSIGIVGLGRLGTMVAEYATAFRMKVSYYDPFVENKKYRRVNSLEELVADNDIITVHIPFNEENRGLFDWKVFSKFKRGSYFVNTARGEVIDSKALIKALNEGIIKAAAVDVVDGEFDPSFKDRVLEHPLVEYASRNSNLLITPHIGGSTRDAWFLTQRYVIDKAIEYMSNRQ